MQFALQPAYIEGKKHALFFENPKFVYSSRELLHYASHFYRLGDDAAALAAGLNGMPRARLRASP
jgi:hypothetical protein